jgi:hypothetical protein
VAGRYRLIREVGRGGMGAVWLAQDELLGREVAVKRLGRFTGAQGRVRAQREAQLAARLSHPNVVTVFDLAEDGETQWLVMEYVAGTTLSRLAADRGGLPPAEAAAIIRQAAEALRVAHAAGIVHRDVKPSNLIVAADGTTKLTDFGIARGDTDDTLTATGILTGSPAYIAPEVASGSTATPASDMWSLGGSLYQALTGRPPYDLGENVVAGLVRIVHEEPPRLAAGSGPLATVLAATMVKDPGHRWTAAQVCAFLDTAPAAPEGATAVAPVPGSTQVLPAMPAPAPAPPPGTPAAAATPTTRARRVRAAPPGGGSPARSHLRSRLLWPLVACALVVVLAAGAWLLGRSGTPRQSAGPTGSSSAPPRSGTAATDSPTASTAASSRATAEGMETFVRTYLATVTRDTRSAFGMLTPSFQQASGGYPGYDTFWGPVQQATPSDVRADPTTMTVSYHVDYRGPRSKVPAADDVRLRLVYEDGRYLIDGEPK